MREYILKVESWNRWLACSGLLCMPTDQTQWRIFMCSERINYNARVFCSSGHVQVEQLLCPKMKIKCKEYRQCCLSCTPAVCTDYEKAASQIFFEWRKHLPKRTVLCSNFICWDLFEKHISYESSLDRETMCWVYSLFRRVILSAGVLYAAIGLHLRAVSTAPRPVVSPGV